MDNKKKFNVEAYSIRELNDLIPELNDEDLCLIAQRYERFDSSKYEGEPEWCLYEEVISKLYKNNETMLKNSAGSFVAPESIKLEESALRAIVADAASKYKCESRVEFATYLNMKLQYAYNDRNNIKGINGTVPFPDEN